jgi:predicted RNA-binding protein with PIN domain
MLIVDAMNVIGSRPTGWWRDRPGAILRLAERLEALCAGDGIEMTVVVDGLPLEDLPEGEYGGLTVMYAARGGANAADDRIVELVGEHEAPETLTVVTSDRTLIARVRDLGAQTSGPSELLRRLDEIDSG